MQFTVSTALGLLVGFGILAAGSKSDPAEKKTRWTDWLPFVLGLLAAAVVSFGLIYRGDVTAGTVGRLLPLPLSIMFAFAAFVAALGQLIRGRRNWMLWATAIVGGLPALFWVWFAAAEILIGHD